MNSESIKHALAIAIEAGCGFEGDTKDAENLLSLIIGFETRIAELEAEVAELKPFRDGYDPETDEPEEGENVIALCSSGIGFMQMRRNKWFDALQTYREMRGVTRWWYFPEVQK